MTKPRDFLRSPQKKAKGLGSARHGADHWIQQRITAVALVLLSLYIVTMFFVKVVFGGYDGAVEMLSRLDAATVTILFLVVAFHHAVLGLQAVIEDYVHTEGLKIASILGIKFISYLFALFGVLLVMKILFWTNLMPEIRNMLTTP